ncbi:MAG TPA: SMI1/KNR4 family protein [Niastella sp.]
MNNNIFATLSLEQNPQYVGELEAKYSIKLPPILKAFLETFEFGKLTPSPQHTILHPNRDLGFDGMEDNLENKFIAYTEAGDYFQAPKVFPIIPSGIYGSGFCIGLTGENTDKVLINFETIENKFEVIAPNILQFIAQLKEVHWDSI